MESRFIDVSWNDNPSEKYTTGIIIHGNSPSNDVLSIVTACSQRELTIESIDTLKRDTHNDYKLLVRVPNKDILRLFILDLERMPFVDRVEREV